VLLIFAIIFIAHSCEKEPLNTEIPYPETIDHSKDFLNELTIGRTDRSSASFIRGEFDGKLIYFTTISSAYYNDDSSWNGIFINNSNGLDQINLIRQTSEDSVQLAIFINQSKIFTRQFPYSPKDDGYAEIQLINLKKVFRVVPGSSGDDSTFLGTTFDSLTFQVTSFSDKILEGTFEGSLKSYSGSTIIVKNGGFRIKVKVGKS
jgi:hypothetical protein